MIVKENVKKFKEDNLIKCKCGSNRYTVEAMEDEDGERTWACICCKKCGKTLFYNGA